MPKKTFTNKNTISNFLICNFKTRKSEKIIIAKKQMVCAVFNAKKTIKNTKHNKKNFLSY